MIVVEASGTTKQLTAGSTATLLDTIFSVPSSGGVLVHDGTSATLHHAAATDPAATASALDHSDTAIAVLDAGSSVIVEMGDKTFTLADGAQTTFDGQVISADSAGGAIVIDGSVTIDVSSTDAATAQSPENSNFEGTEESTGTTDAQSTGSARPLPMQAAVVFAVLGFLMVAL